VIPYLFIFIAALVGLYIWGFMGLILGAVGGYLLTFVFGLLLLRLNAGVVPREYRESTATSFISLHPDLIQGAFPNANQKAVHKAVEDHLERIFQRAAIDNKSIFLNPQHKVAIHDAATQLISEEQNLQMKAFLVSLEEHIEREMYPYESSCWRREYFSLIKQFLNLEAAGMAVYGQEYDVEKTFPNLLKHRYPDWTEKEIKDFIVRNQERFLSDYYKNQFFDVAKKANDRRGVTHQRPTP